MDKMRRRGLASPSMLDLSSSPSSSPSSASPLARMNSNSNDLNGGGRSNAPGVLSALKSFRLFRAKKVSESDPPSATMSTPSFQAPPPSPRKQKISQPTDPRLLGPPRPMHIPTTRSHTDLPSTSNSSLHVHTDFSTSPSPSLSPVGLSPNGSRENLPRGGSPNNASNLAAISRKSRSVDDLTKFAMNEEDFELANQIEQYRRPRAGPGPVPPSPGSSAGRSRTMDSATSDTDNRAHGSTALEFPKIVTSQHHDHETSLHQQADLHAQASSSFPHGNSQPPSQPRGSPGGSKGRQDSAESSHAPIQSRMRSLSNNMLPKFTSKPSHSHSSSGGGRGEVHVPQHQQQGRPMTTSRAHDSRGSRERLNSNSAPPAKQPPPGNNAHLANARPMLPHQNRSLPNSSGPPQAPHRGALPNSASMPLAGPIGGRPTPLQFPPSTSTSASTSTNDLFIGGSGPGVGTKPGSPGPLGFRFPASGPRDRPGTGASRKDSNPSSLYGLQTPSPATTQFPRTNPNSNNMLSVNMNAGKRASQLIHHSSFLNQYDSSATSHAHGNIVYHNVGREKAWNPRKAVVQGTKLLLYKPPKDRAAEVRELFASEMLPEHFHEREKEREGEQELSPIMDREEEEVPGSGGAVDGKTLAARIAAYREGGAGNGSDERSPRPERIFRGHTRHPKLVVDANEHVQSGSMHALLHEVVFATTFLVASDQSPSELPPPALNIPAQHDADLTEGSLSSSVSASKQPPGESPPSSHDGVSQTPTGPAASNPDGPDQATTADHSRYRLGAWKSFAQAAITVLPSSRFLGREQFESELLGHCENMTSTSDTEEGNAEDSGEDGLKRFASERVRWINDTYREFWGGFGNDRVSGWQAVLRKLGPVSESDSTAPVANSSSEPSSESSDRFISPSSSAPGQTVPLLSPFPSTSALQSASTLPFPFPSSSPKSAKQRWNSLADLLDREGFLPGLLASNRVGVERAASSLASWTHYQLLTLLWELKVENRSVTRALLERVVFLNANEETGHWKLFYGDDKEMHWLTRLVLQHVLTPSAPSSSSTSSNVQEPQRSSTSQPAQPVSSRSRGRIITSWVEVAEACRASGDESSFQAIRAALTSRPVVRLEKAWREVAANIKNIVDNWAMARMRSYPQAQVSGRGLEALKEAETSDASPIPPAPPLSRSPSSGGGGFLLTPWIAPELETIGRLIGQSETSGGGIIEVDNLLSIHSALDKIVERFRLCANADDDAERNLIPLWKQWETLSCKSPKDSPSFSSCCEISFSVEPRTRAHFVEHFGVPSTSTIPPLAPFDFPRPFRELSLIPRFALSSSATSEAQFTISESRMQDILSLGTPSSVTRKSGRLAAMAHAGPSVANPRRMQTLGLPGTTNIGEEFGESMVTTFDGEVVLKVLRAAPSPRVSRALSKARGDTSERTSRDRRGGDTSNRSSRLDAGDGFGIREDVSDNSSHTLSRAPSISVAMPGTLNRKTSHTSLLSRRSSLPSLKRGPSLIHPEPKTATTLVAAVHAASTDRLINILIDGLEVTASTADDSGFGFGGAWSISVDREDFRRTWWASFRSFVRVLAFFELLTKGPRGLGIANDSEESPATQRRIRVLDVMRDWLVNGGGAQDLVDFLDLAEAWNTYLDDLIRHSSVPHVKSSAQDLRRATTIHILSPIRMFGGMASEESSAPDAAAPNIDAISAAEIVDSFNGIAKAVMSILPSKDIMIAADILEVQLSDRGFYAPKEPVPHQEDVLSETIHSLLCRVPPSPLVTKFHGKNQFHRSLPSSLRLILQAHQAIRIWVTSKIASPAINQQTREDRILKAIRAVEICRLRSASSRKSDPFSILVPSAPSFVETAIIAALWSPESRVYRSAWACVASTLQVSTETLQALLSGPGSSMELPIDSKECTVDGGWLFEQILGVLSLPDNIERSDLPLVNFDKRRYIVQIAETFGHQTAFMNSTYENDVARMNSLLTDAGHFNRLGKAAREAAEVEDNLFSKRGPSSRRPPYPFKPLAVAEVEKLRRDYSFREKLDREREIEHQKASQREQNLDRAMQLQRAPTTKHQRGKRSVAGGVTLFLRSAVVRPASAAWGSARPPTKLRSAAELDFEPSGKPSDKLSLHSARVTPYASDERPYLFQLTTEDGGHWLFQASSLFEQTAWMKAIEAAAQKGASMDFDSTGPADILVKSSRKAGGVFGVPLETLIERENPNANDLSDKIPRALEHMLLAIERRDLSETGLYRMSGSKAQVLAIQQAFDDGGMPNLDEDGQFTDIHALTGAVKAYCRDLPEPLIPYEFFKQLITILHYEPFEQRLHIMRKILQAIPSSSYATLRRLVQHFDTIAELYPLNQMHPQNLALCVTVSMLHLPESWGPLANLGSGTQLVRILIGSYHAIFEAAPEPEPEVAQDSESDPEPEVAITVEEPAELEAEEDGDLEDESDVELLNPDETVDTPELLAELDPVGEDASEHAESVAEESTGSERSESPLPALRQPMRIGSLPPVSPLTPAFAALTMHHPPARKDSLPLSTSPSNPSPLASN